MNKTKSSTWVFTAIFSVVVVSCVNSSNNRQQEREQIVAQKSLIEAAKSPEIKAAEKAARAHAENEFQFGVKATKLAKNGLKNPASFEFINAGVVDGGALCLTYRATNSFNAIVTSCLNNTLSYKLNLFLCTFYLL